MTKTLKMLLIGGGFILLVALKMFLTYTFEPFGGSFWIPFAVGYLAYARTIWHYQKETSQNNTLDKHL